MKLPFLQENKEKSEYYLALILLDEKVSAVILESIEGKIKVMGRHEEHFSSSIETISHDDFLATIDKAISTAEETLPPNIETHKTVFGVKESWIEEETKKIKKEHLADLKKMCSSLNLSPIGFMVTSEAIAHFLQEEEGAPLSAIFVEIGKSYVDVALYRGGKVIEKANGELEDSAPATVDKLLKHLTVPVLPARIVLFHAEKGEKLSQQFISYQWSKTLPFLHMPQITVLPEGFDAQAVTSGAATQMGLEVLNIGERLIPEELISESSADTDTIEKEVNKEEETDLPSHINEPEPHEDHQPKHLDHHLTKGSETDFGFIVGQDVSEMKPSAHPAHKPIHNQPEQHHPVHHQLHKKADIDEELEDEVRSENLDTKISPLSFLSRLSPLSLFSNLHLPNPSNLGPSRGLFKIAIPLGILIILVLGLSFVYFFKTKTTVTLTVKPKVVEQSAHVTFSTTSPTDFSKNIIAAKGVSTTIDGELSKDATGKKDTGEKAKGTITLFSRLSQSKTFTAGTTITANNHNFTLDKDVNVASSSGDASSEPSKANVSVTAADIGTDSNLPSGAKFSVKGFDSTDVIAKNDNAFSGGSKKSLTAVSKEDLAKLKTDLPKNLESKAREALAKKAAGDEIVLPLFLDISLEKTKFDKNAGDEAKKVTLKATITYTGLAYNSKEFSEYAKTLLKNKYSQDIGFAENSIKGEAKDSKAVSEKEAETTTTITAGLLPTISEDEVKEKIHGKSLAQVKEIVNNLPQVIKSDITFSPNIPFLANLFPSLPSNIKVAVKSE
jgi:hypothetical protein